MAQNRTYNQTMKVVTPSYVKGNMAKVLDAALAGEPTVIVRKGRLAILKEYDPQTDRFRGCKQRSTREEEWKANRLLWT